MASGTLRTGFLGGSFNPVHAGHVRAAVEAREQLGLDGVEFLPAAAPPHKPAAGMLPFAFRCEMLECAIAGLDGLSVNAMEGERQGLSYTWDTLGALSAERPGHELYFIMGATDLLHLPAWNKGLQLVQRASLAVFAREGVEEEAVRNAVQAYWPEAKESAHRFGQAAASWRVGECRVCYIDIPRLDVSASLVRERWLAGRETAGLVPRKAAKLLEQEGAAVAACWKKKSAP